MYLKADCIRIGAAGLYRFRGAAPIHRSLEFSDPVDVRFNTQAALS
jgi:hypothetical protein